LSANTDRLASCMLRGSCSRVPGDVLSTWDEFPSRSRRSKRNSDPDWIVRGPLLPRSRPTDHGDKRQRLSRSKTAAVSDSRKRSFSVMGSAVVVGRVVHLQTRNISM
jgi:hypothetical protein